MKQRHMWTRWNRVERCSRRGCPALRKGLSAPFWYRVPKGEWGRLRPACAGQASTNKP